MATTSKSPLAVTLKQNRPFVSLQQEAFLSILRTASDLSNTADKLLRQFGVTVRQIAAVKKAGTARLIVVGGAGLLEVAPGVTLIASGYLPEAYLPIATSHEKALGSLKASDINWTYFSPAGYFEAGERTGKFRLGTTNLIANEKGDSRISYEDYAVGLVDEIETPAHERGQLSIGY